MPGETEIFDRLNFDLPVSRWRWTKVSVLKEGLGIKGITTSQVGRVLMKLSRNDERVAVKNTHNTKQYLLPPVASREFMHYEDDDLPLFADGTAFAGDDFSPVTDGGVVIGAEYQLLPGEKEMLNALDFNTPVSKWQWRKVRTLKEKLNLMDVTDVQIGRVLAKFARNDKRVRVKSVHNIKQYLLPPARNGNLMC